MSERTYRPALGTLLHNQAALLSPDVDGGRAIEHSWREGFPDRRSLISWYQRAVVRTLGYLADDFPPERLFQDDVLLAGAIRDPVVNSLPELADVQENELLERALRESSLLVEPMPDEQARQYRRLLESHVIQPACQRGYHDLRGRAGEYTPTDKRGEEIIEIAPGEQKYVAMRPGLQELDERQARALGRLWGGFGEFDELLDWLHSLSEPANGELPDNFAQLVVDDPVCIKYMYHETDTNVARLYRELWSVGVLLPIFVDGVRELAAGEVADAERDGPGVAQL